MSSESLIVDVLYEKQSRTDADGGATYEGMSDDRESLVVDMDPKNTPMDNDVLDIVKRAPYKREDRNELIVSKSFKKKDSFKASSPPIDIPGRLREQIGNESYHHSSPNDIKEKSPVQKIAEKLDEESDDIEIEDDFENEEEGYKNTEGGGRKKSDDTQEMGMSELLFSIDDDVVDSFEGGYTGGGEGGYNDYFEVSS